MASKTTALLVSFAAIVVFGVPAASAHSAFTVASKYTVKIGWLNEPPIVDQGNAITVEVVDTSGTDDVPIEGLKSSLTVEVIYGAEVKKLEVDATEDPGVYAAGILPSVEGIYTVHVSGNIKGSAIPEDGKNKIKVEGVQGNEDVAFPESYSSRADLDGQVSMLRWIVFGAVLVAVVGLVVGFIGLSAARAARKQATPTGSGTTTQMRPPAGRP